MKLRLVILFFLLLIIFGCTNSKKEFSEGANIHYSLNKLNSPVALHFTGQEYHLFYTYLIDGTQKIGRLTSNNLINWKKNKCRLGESNNENIRTISIIRSWNNTAEKKVALFFSFVINNNGLMVYRSDDEGETWEKWDQEIFIDNSFDSVNDIKIAWNEDIQKWVMVLLKDYEVEFYTSFNLKDWEYHSVFNTEPTVKKGNWVAVEFFPIEYPETMEIKWCLAISSTEGASNYGRGTQYFVGEFNELQFQTEDDVKWMDAGTDLHSPVVLSDHLIQNKPLYCLAKVDDSKTITLPRSISLIRKFNEFYLASTPIKEINQYHHKTKKIAGQEFEGKLSISQKQQLPMEINLKFDFNNRKYLDFAEVFGVVLKNEDNDKLIIGYHNIRRYFFISYKNEIVYAPGIIEKSNLEMKLIIDEATVELFSMNGQISMTKQYSAQKLLNQIQLFTEGGKITLKDGSLTKLISNYN